MAFETHDSGQRAAFGTGAVRDLAEGKGRFDLLPPLAMARLTRVIEAEPGETYCADSYDLMEDLHNAHSGDQSQDWLAYAVLDAIYLMSGEGGQFKAVQRIAQLYERGAKKYAARNWEQGIPVTRMFDSALRHAYQAVTGVDDGEDHYAAVCFNLLGIMEYEERADLWDTDAYSDLFVDLGDLYYRNNPKRIVSGTKLMHTPSVESAVAAGVEQGKIRFEPVTLFSGKIVMLPKPEDVVAMMESRNAARERRGQ